jgi:hypothetical protein
MSARGHALNNDLTGTVEHYAGVLDGLSTAQQVTWIVVSLLVVAGSAVVAERLTAPFLRLLEGYWPGGRPRWLWRRSVALSCRRRRRLRAEWGALRAAVDPTPADRTREGVLALRLHGMPSEDLAMPTALGNILRAGELRPSRRYGLDAVVIWPRLWLLLPETTRQEISTARGQIDATGRAVLWVLAAVIWSPWLWWIAPIAFGIGMLIYRRGLLPAATTYSDLVEAAFDLHRVAVYKALRLPPPVSAADEPAAGAALTSYLWEGHPPESLRFTDPD